MNMNLEYKIIRKDQDDLTDIKRLYERSFPENERIPFRFLLNKYQKDALFYAAYQDKKLVGLYHVFLSEELIYLSYICVDVPYQNKGAGTAILQHVHETCAGRLIVVDIEEVCKEDENYDDEVRRRDFYIRNGYQSTGVFYHFYDVDYELLSYGGEVSRQMWIDMTLKIWGPRAKGARYRGM